MAASEPDKSASHASLKTLTSCTAKRAAAAVTRHRLALLSPPNNSLCLCPPLPSLLSAALSLIPSPFRQTSTRAELSQLNVTSSRPPRSPPISPSSRTPSQVRSPAYQQTDDASSASASAGVPHALAALLHQSDRNGRPQATSSGPIASSSVTLSVASSGVGAAGSQQARSPPHAPWFVLCCGAAEGSPPDRPPQLGGSADGVGSATGGSQTTLPASSAASSSTSPGMLALNIAPLSLSPSRHGVAQLVAQPDTPSRVLSPTSKLATVREKERYERSEMAPWGSRHPHVVNAANREGWSWSGNGVTPTKSHAPYLTSPLSSAPRLLRQVVETGPRIPPPGGLNAEGHPALRINNVRRPSSTVGEGPLLSSVLDIDRGRHCLIVRAATRPSCRCPARHSKRSLVRTNPRPHPRPLSARPRRDARALVF